MQKYVNDALIIKQCDENASINIKKIILNMETILRSFKGRTASKILFERAKVLAAEKSNYIKDIVQAKENNDVKEILLIKELEKSKEQKQKMAEQILIEKEMLKRKCMNFSKTAEFIKKAHSENNVTLSNSNTTTNNFKCDLINNNNCLTEDINSDIETSSVVSEDNNYQNICNSSNNVNNGNYSKTLKKEFFKLLLKAKFENKHSNKKAVFAINENVLFDECLKLNIPKEKWQEFIEKELKQPLKYVKVAKSAKNYNKIEKNLKSNLKMDVIFEEEF